MGPGRHVGGVVGLALLLLTGALVLPGTPDLAPGHGAIASDRVGSVRSMSPAPPLRTPAATVGPNACAPSNGSTFTLNALDPHPRIDLGSPMSISTSCTLPSAVENTTHVAYLWSGLPPGHCSAPGRSFIVCYASEIGTYRVKVVGYANVTDGTRGPWVAYDTANTTVNNSVSVQIGVFPRTGPAPLTVNLSTSVSGGTPPFTISWLTGDQNLGLGKSFTHTYVLPGTFLVQVWVNDSTVAFAANQSWYGAFNVTVSAAPVPGGIFGLHGLREDAVLGALAAVIVGVVIYAIATRNRAPRLPRPERWMVPGADRPGRPAGEPPASRGPDGRSDVPSPRSP